MRKILIFALALIGIVSCGTNNSEKTTKTMTYQELVASRYSCKNKNNVFTYPGGKRDSGVEDACIVAHHREHGKLPACLRNQQ